MTSQATDQKPPPEQMTELKEGSYIVNELPIIVKRPVPDADNLENMTSQATGEKPPTEQMTELKEGSHIVNELPIIVKRPVLDADNLRAAETSNPETKVNVERSPRSPGALMLPGTSDNIQILKKTIPSSRRRAVLKTIKMRDDFFWPRCLLHIINLIGHIANIIVLHQAVESITTPDPQMAKFLSMKFRYLITWVVVLHIYYSVVALISDVSEKMCKCEKIDEKPQDPVEKFEEMLNHPPETIFKGVIWPATILVTVFFWPVFIYDRELIFPKFVDEVLSCVSNYLLHAWIAIFVFLEVLLYPRLRPRHHTFGHAEAWMAKLKFLAIYAFVFYHSYFAEDIWLYPIFSVAYNSGIIYFIILNTGILLVYFNTTRFFWLVHNWLRSFFK